MNPSSQPKRIINQSNRSTTRATTSIEPQNIAALETKIANLEATIDRLKDTQEQLIRILAPLFPTTTTVYDVGFEIQTAASQARQRSITSVANANLRGERTIPNDAFGKNVKSVKTKVMRLLNYLSIHYPVLVGDDGVAVPRSAEEIEGDYRELKSMACMIRRGATNANPEIQGLNWKQVSATNPSLSHQMVLELESKACMKGIQLHLCTGSWASERLMSESYRGSLNSSRANNETAANDESYDSYMPSSSFAYFTGAGNHSNNNNNLFQDDADQSLLHYPFDIPSTSPSLSYEESQPMDATCTSVPTAQFSGSAYDVASGGELGVFVGQTNHRKGRSDIGDDVNDEDCIFNQANAEQIPNKVVRTGRKGSNRATTSSTEVSSKRRRGGKKANPLGISKLKPPRTRRSTQGGGARSSRCHLAL